MRHSAYLTRSVRATLLKQVGTPVLTRRHRSAILPCSLKGNEHASTPTHLWLCCCQRLWTRYLRRRAPPAVVEGQPENGSSETRRDVRGNWCAGSACIEGI